MKNNKMGGFTLLELMITIAIVIILTTIGIPSFVGLIRDSNMTATANDFLTALNYARSEAVTRNTNVIIKSKSGTNKDWKAGWDVFADTNNNNTLDAGELLKTHEALANSYTLTANAANLDTQVLFKSTGLRDSVIGGTFFLCKDGDTTTARAIIINSVGRARVDAGASCS